MTASSPTCRVCWLSSLTDAEHERAVAEPVVAVVHLCPWHRAEHDRMVADLDLPMIRATDTPRRFTRHV